MTGLDISSRLLAIAQIETGGRATLIEADASIWSSDKPFDLAVSRFGLMFFEDRQQGFSNVGRNLRPGGRLVFCCWRSVSDNPWVTAPLSAVRDLLPERRSSKSVEQPYAAGPFALSDIKFVRELLRRAGFELIQVHIHEFPVVFSNLGVEAAVAFALEMGPTAAALWCRATFARSLSQLRPGLLLYALSLALMVRSDLGLNSALRGSPESRHGTQGAMSPIWLHPNVRSWRNCAVWSVS